MLTKNNPHNGPSQLLFAELQLKVGSVLPRLLFFRRYLCTETPEPFYDFLPQIDCTQ